jgi:hypothetical protein
MLSCEGDTRGVVTKAELLEWVMAPGTGGHHLREMLQLIRVRIHQNITHIIITLNAFD